MSLKNTSDPRGVFVFTLLSLFLSACTTTSISLRPGIAPLEAPEVAQEKKSLLLRKPSLHLNILLTALMNAHQDFRNMWMAVEL